MESLEYGVLAQLVERCVRIAEVRGSNPLSSTTSEWTTLHSKSPAIWLGISHTTSSFLLSAKSHACCGYALVNAGMTPLLRYQLFAGCARVQIPF